MAYTEKVREISQAVGRVSPKTNSEIALFGYLVGAAFSLSEALRLRYRDRTGTRLPKRYPIELARIARKVSRGQTINHGQWLAGFYFNSALHRLAALNERIDKYAGIHRDLGASVRQEVNKMKHDIEGVMNGRKVTLRQAVAVLKQLTGSLLLVTRSRTTT